ncbi:MAG: hypothetical protein HY328_16635 [Chloroflexi bacterium]|nr:hypothetical protein [Chloroflexota bacterium]
MPYSPTETIFDFHVAEIAPERIHAWQERAEYLLDEAVAGAASFQAVEEEPLREQWTGPNRANPLPAVNGSAQKSFGSGSGEETQVERPALPDRTTIDFGLLRSEISGLLDVEAGQIRVFPETELPAINYRGGLSAAAPAPALTQAAPETPHSSFVDSNQPSRFLRTPTESPAQPAGSLLTRPAPVLGKIPPPATPPVSLTAGQVRFLDEEIAHLYGEVNRVLATRREITGHALSLLREAREILFAEPHRLGRAEYNLTQVRSILERAQDSRRQSSRRGFQVLLYLALWLAGTVAAGVALFLYGAELTRVSVVLLGSQSRVVAHLHPFLWVMITGSAGAVVGAILGFLAHIRSEQDFDRQHVMRFAIQPMMGVVLGILLYLLFSLLFASMQIDLTARAVTRALPVVLALPAGLWQEWIYASLYRMMGFFTLRPRRR